MAGRPLRPASRRCLGRPLPHQQADSPRVPPEAINLSSPGHAVRWGHPVLAPVSRCYPGLRGRLLTCYSPVRRSVTTGIATRGPIARLACIRHAASVRPEPGSNPPSRSQYLTRFRVGLISIARHYSSGHLLLLSGHAPRSFDRVIVTFGCPRYAVLKAQATQGSTRLSRSRLGKEHHPRVEGRRIV